MSHQPHYLTGPPYHDQQYSDPRFSQHIQSQNYRQPAPQQHQYVAMQAGGYAANMPPAANAAGTNWPPNMPSQYAPTSLQLQYPAYQQQHTVISLQQQPGFPSGGVAWPAPATNVFNYPSGTQLIPNANYGGATFGAPAPQPQLMQHQPHQHRQHQQSQQPQQHNQPQQPNPAYAQSFVPPVYASGTRPQSAQAHSQAQFHPQAPQVQPTQHQIMMPAQFGGGIVPQLDQPHHIPAQALVPQQPPPPQPPQVAKERRRLSIFNPDTREEVKHYSALSRSSSAGRVALAGPAASGDHQAYRGPPTTVPQQDTTS